MTFTGHMAQNYHSRTTYEWRQQHSLLEATIVLSAAIQETTQNAMFGCKKIQMADS